MLDIHADRTKVHISHVSIIPKQLAEKLLESAQRNNYSILMPQYQSIWRKITALAKAKYHVRLTSHYFRKRFHSIASRIPAHKMSPNQWAMLMGDKGSIGHLPHIYDIEADLELCKQYETYLAPELDLGTPYLRDEHKHQDSAASQTQPTESLPKILKSLQDTIKTQQEQIAQQQRLIESLTLSLQQ